LKVPGNTQHRKYHLHETDTEIRFTNQKKSKLYKIEKRCLLKLLMPHRRKQASNCMVFKPLAGWSKRIKRLAGRQNLLNRFILYWIKC